MDVQNAWDKVFIAELIGRYSHAVNDADFERWASCFTEDGIFVGAFDQFRAHTDLDRFIAESVRLMERWPNLRLQFTDVESDLDGDRAQAHCNLVMTTTSPERVTSIVFVAEYDDSLIKTGDGWLFEKRVVTVCGS